MSRKPKHSTPTYGDHKWLERLHERTRTRGNALLPRSLDPHYRDEVAARKFKQYDRVSIPLFMRSPERPYGIVIGYLWSDETKVVVSTSRGVAHLYEKELKHYD